MTRLTSQVRSTEETIQHLAEQAERIEAMFAGPLSIARALLATTRREDAPMVGGRRNIDPIGDAA